MNQILKYSLTFTAGAVVNAAAVLIAGGKPAHMLTLGAVLAVVAIALLCWMIGPRRLTRLLEALASSPARSPRRRAAAAVNPTDPIAADVVSALVGQGVPRRSAAKAVCAAARTIGESDFEQLFRESLKALA